jgi:hypothetical protein
VATTGRALHRIELAFGVERTLRRSRILSRKNGTMLA